MPLYEYRCRSCGQTFERLVRMGSVEAPSCPVCGTVDAQKLVSAIARPMGGGGGGDCGPSGGT